VLQGSFSFDLLLLYCNFFGATGLVFLLELMMYASVRVEGKFLELFGGEGGAFPFRVMEFSRRRGAFIKLSNQEYRSLAVEMVRFCSSKGEPIWVITLKGANRCLLLQLRQNARGRFIVFSLIGSIGRSRTLIFPEGRRRMVGLL